MTIHKVLGNSIPELNRVLELIQKESAKPVQTQTIINNAPSGGGTVIGASSAGQTGPTGPTGPQGPAGADGSAANLLVGANHQVEVLVGPNGDVLTDNWGLALMGVNVTSTIITGADTVSIGVLNAS